MNIARATVQGHYTVRVYRRGLGLVQEREFPNLITNAGLDHLGTRAWTGVSPSSLIYWSHLGLGTAEPDPTDIALQAPVSGGVARHGSGVTIVNSAGPGNGGTFYLEDPPRVRIVRNIQCTYPAGAIVGNLSEVGVGPGTTSTAGALFSRALILDSLGNPTTVTATAEDTVVVVYTLTIDFTGKSSGVVTVNAVNYPYVTDLSGETSHLPYQMWEVNTTAATLNQGAPATLATMDPWASPATSYTWTARSASRSLAAYTPGSYYRDSTATFPTGVGSPGIQGVRLHMGGSSANVGLPWRVRFDSPIPFTINQQFSITVRSTWERA